MNRFIVLLFCMALIVGCKDDQKSNSQIATQEKAVPKLQVKINCKSDKKDFLQCAFNRIEFANNREGIFIIKEDIQASDELNEFNFEMFNDNISTLLQLKLGKNPKKLIIESILVEYGDRKVNVSGAEIDRYFSLNQFVSFNKETKTLTTKSINGKHAPVITLKQGFIKRIFKIN